MGFSLLGRNLPRIRSYQDALSLYEKNEKFDQGYGWRGIVSKRDTSKRMCVSDGESIVFCYHQTNMVVWHPDHVVAVTYDTPSSVVFSDAFLPLGISAMSVRGVMGFSTPKYEFLKPCGRSLMFEFSKPRNIWEPCVEECAQFSTYTLDRKKAAEVRKKLKDWVDWRDVMVRMHGESPQNFNYGHGMGYLARMLKDGVPNAGRSELFRYKTFHSENLFRDAYILAGAVEKQKLPFGSLPKKTAYGDSIAWRFI